VEGEKVQHVCRKRVQTMEETGGIQYVICMGTECVELVGSLHVSHEARVCELPPCAGSVQCGKIGRWEAKVCACVVAGSRRQCACSMQARVFHPPGKIIPVVLVGRAEAKKAGRQAFSASGTSGAGANGAGSVRAVGVSASSTPHGAGRS